MTPAPRCTEKPCGELAVVRIAWPGRGWLYFCERHGRWAQEILEITGGAWVVEYL